MTTPVQIPDAAVQAASKAYCDGYDAYDDHDKAVNAAITAALPHLPLGFEVKKLGEWRRGYCDDFVTIQQSSNGFGSIYQIRVLNGAVWLDFPEHSSKEVVSVEQAKAAAQADFERRVRECVVAKPVDVAAVRRQALEEAATLIDEGFEKAVGKSWRNDGKPSKNDKCPHDKFMYEDCENCASAAIRALSAEPAQGEQWHPTHRHVKRDTDYQLIGTGKMQAEAWFDYASGASADMQKVAIYRGDDGQLWVRPIAEFIDGRFEPLSAAPTSEEEA